MNQRTHTLMDPDFHDGSLYGLSVDGGNLEIRCEAVDGRRYSLKLTGLERLQANDFRQGNIVFDVALFVGLDCPDNLLRAAYGIRAEEPLDREEIDTQGWTLLRIRPSYGCDLLALSRGPSSIAPEEGSNSS